MSNNSFAPLAEGANAAPTAAKQSAAPPAKKLSDAPCTPVKAVGWLICCRIFRRIWETDRDARGKPVYDPNGRQRRKPTDTLEIVCPESRYNGRVFNQGACTIGKDGSMVWTLDTYMEMLAEDGIVWRSSHSAGWRTAKQYKPQKSQKSRTAKARTAKAPAAKDPTPDDFKYDLYGNAISIAEIAEVAEIAEIAEVAEIAEIAEVAEVAEVDEVVEVAEIDEVDEVDEVAEVDEDDEIDGQCVPQLVPHGGYPVIMQTVNGPIQGYFACMQTPYGPQQVFVQVPFETVIAY